MQTKLTLRMDEELIQRAKRYADLTGKSVSQIVADYFALVDGGDPATDLALTPRVKALKGALKGATAAEDDYRRHLETKYE